MDLLLVDDSGNVPLVEQRLLQKDTWVVLNALVPTTFMINLKQMPAQSYLNFQVCYEMKNLWQLE